ncbi:DivIVA domain-containing protein [Nocardia sp. NPDC048505]|uniref:DivIVA domain-containing protein n=1 Tax=unclassified Nocardia TaxID=2637762 RepID=UPI0033EE4912
MALKPRDIEKAKFKRSALGRRGYDENDVEEFLERVAREVSRLNATNKRLTQQLEFSGEKSLLSDNDYLSSRVADLERQLSMYKSSSSGDNAFTVEQLRSDLAAVRRENHQLREEAQHDLLGVNIRAVNMLSQAQLSAETTVAEAEGYARELVAAARQQYADILRQAQESAAQAADGIASLTSVPKGAPEPVPAEIEYIRTYAQIAQKQMHTIVEALFSEIDKLGEPKTAQPQPASRPVQAEIPAPPEAAGKPAPVSYWNPAQLTSSDDFSH